MGLARGLALSHIAGVNMSHSNTSVYMLVNTNMASVGVNHMASALTHGSVLIIARFYLTQLQSAAAASNIQAVGSASALLAALVDRLPAALAPRLTFWRGHDVAKRNKLPARCWDHD